MLTDKSGYEFTITELEVWEIEFLVTNNILFNKYRSDQDEKQNERQNEKQNKRDRERKREKHRRKAEAPCINVIILNAFHVL
jgi:hypothetical protein